MEEGLKVNVPKTKILCSSHDATKTMNKSVKFPCGVCSMELDQTQYSVQVAKNGFISAVQVAKGS